MTLSIRINGNGEQETIRRPINLKSLSVWNIRPAGKSDTPNLRVAIDLETGNISYISTREIKLGESLWLEPHQKEPAFLAWPVKTFARIYYRQPDGSMANFSTNVKYREESDAVLMKEGKSSEVMCPRYAENETEDQYKFKYYDDVLANHPDPVIRAVYKDRAAPKDAAPGI